MKRVFLAFAFRENDRELANQVEQLLGSHDVRAVTGKSVGGEALTPAVRGLIDETDGLIALLTRRDKIANRKNKYTTHQWVQDELGHARGNNKPAIAMIETGVDVGGMYAENEYIPFDPENPLEAFLRLSETIGGWKQQFGRRIEAVILPPDLATKIGQGTIKCRYRFYSKEGKWTKWEETEPANKIGGTFVHLTGVREDDSIQLEVTLEKTKWQSIASPQWIQIELGEVK